MTRHDIFCRPSDIRITDKDGHLLRVVPAVSHVSPVDHYATDEREKTQDKRRRGQANRKRALRALWRRGVHGMGT